MKKYFVDDFITYCYPYEVSKATKNYGVLTQYIGKYFDRDEMDKIICEMIMKHPYIENSMWLKLSIKWIEEDTIGYYHILVFENDNDKKQSKGSTIIKYEN